MTTIAVQLTQAPTTPLNLRFGVTYAPRIEAPPFVGFRAVEAEPERCVIEAFDAQGDTTEVFRGTLAETFYRLALHLRMDT